MRRLNRTDPPLAPGDDASSDTAQRAVAASARDAESAPRVEGVSFRDNWRAEVTDKVAFVAAIAARPDLVNLVDPNVAALNHLARAYKGALDIAGVRVWCEQIVAASRRL
jgi:hypothetical protein